MTEERKHAILFAASLMCARKLMESIEDEKPNMGREFWTGQLVEKAIDRAVLILDRIDKRWPCQDQRSR